MRVATCVEKLTEWLVEHASVERTDPWRVALRAQAPHRTLECVLARARCRPCQVANALTQLLTWQREEQEFGADLEFARSLDDGVGTMKSVASLRQQLDAALARATERRAHLVDPGDSLRDDLRAMKHALDAFERIRDRVRDGLRADVTSEQLREPAMKKPRAILLQNVEMLLSFVGFSDREISDLIDDGEGGESPRMVDRIRKRRAAAMARERDMNGPRMPLALVVRGYSLLGAAPPRVVLRWSARKIGGA